MANTFDRATLDDVRTRLGVIAEVAKCANDEGCRASAHIMEDELFIDVLYRVSLGEDDPQTMSKIAKLALTSREIKFDRVC